ncbi:MAG: DUF1259 domain-containing protein [Tepidisphaeraceae bacterium]
MRTTLCLALILTCIPLLSRGAEDELSAATQPTAESWEQIAKDLGHAGELKDNVYTITLLRTDMEIRDEDGDIPAGLLKTEFQFYPCDCGKMNVAGQFCLFEYESDDVIDALRAGRMKVVSVSPMFQGEHPRVTLVRFQGSAESSQIAKPLKDALKWTGEARMAPATRPVE